VGGGSIGVISYKEGEGSVVRDISCHGDYV
jgi:hypothetical protein